MSSGTKTTTSQPKSAIELIKEQHWGITSQDTKTPTSVVDHKLQPTKQKSALEVIKELHWGLKPEIKEDPELCVRSLLVSQKPTVPKLALTFSDKKRIINCPQCNYNGTTYNLRRHMITLHKTPPESFEKMLKTVKEETIKERGNNIYRCAECPSVYSKMDCLYRHMKRKHEDPTSPPEPAKSENQPLHCSSCDLSFETRAHFARHFSQHHAPDSAKHHFMPSIRRFQSEDELEMWKAKETFGLFTELSGELKTGRCIVSHECPAFFTERTFPNGASDVMFVLRHSHKELSESDHFMKMEIKEELEDDFDGEQASSSVQNVNTNSMTLLKETGELVGQVNELMAYFLRRTSTKETCNVITRLNVTLRMAVQDAYSALEKQSKNKRTNSNR